MMLDPKYNVFHSGKWESIDQITSVYEEKLEGAKLGIPKVEIWIMHKERRGCNFKIKICRMLSSTGRRIVGSVCRECKE
jgi:hypothetical protein